MRRALLTGLLAVCITAGGICPLSAQDGHFGLLTDIHGYTSGGRTLVPMRGIAEWAGATVAWNNPVITINRDATEIIMRVNETRALVNGNTVVLDVPPRVYGGITCVPLRFVGESLGLEVAYQAPVFSDTDEPTLSERLGGYPFVQLRSGRREARIIIHEEPPNVVARIIADLSNTTQYETAYAGPEPFSIGRYGHDWILRVTRIRSGYFFSDVPARYNSSMYPGYPVFYSPAAAVYGLRGGTWKYILGFSDVPTRGLWEDAGIPRSVAHELGIILLDSP